MLDPPLAAAVGFTARAVDPSTAAVDVAAHGAHFVVGADGTAETSPAV